MNSGSGSHPAQPEFNLDVTSSEALGERNPWNDFQTAAPSTISNQLLTPSKPNFPLSPTSSAASPLLHIDPSILAEFDPFASTEPAGKPSRSTTSDLENEVNTALQKKVDEGVAPGLVLSGLYPTDEKPNGTVAEEVAPKTETDNSPEDSTLSKRTQTQSNLASSSSHRSSSPVSGPSKQGTDNSGRTRSDSTNSQDGSKDKGVTFDFQGFLVQLRTKPAEPIQKYLKSFLVSFAKRPFTVNEQIKLIHDFLEFISEKMKKTEPWRSMDESRFANSMEAMEKLVMNRLYTFTFSPMIDPSVHPITTDDLERDSVLTERIRIFSWVREKHLDVPEGEASQGFLAFAEQELLKINHYKAPRDKMICILNCCKVIFGLIRHEAGSDKTSADAFLPILIFVVLRANPDNMISNIEYINRFRSAPSLQGEPGYYLSSLGGAISFIETMDASGLSNISREDFERNVEQAVAQLPARESRASRFNGPIQGGESPITSSLANTAEGEEPARDLTSLPINIALDTKRFFQRTGEFASEAVSRPLSAIGKIIDSIGNASDSEEGSGDEYPGNSQRRPTFPNDSPRTPSYQARIRAPRPVYRSPANNAEATQTANASPLGGLFGRRTSNVPHGVPSHPDDRLQVNEMYARNQVDFSTPPPGPMTPSDDPTFNFEDLTAEIDRNTTTARQAGIDTLHQMFPDIDREVAGVILDSCQNDLGQAIDRMLEMAAG